MILTRRPRSAAVTHNIIKKEVRTAWEAAAKAAIEILKEDVDDWVEPPEFSFSVTLGKIWKFIIKFDKRTDGGKHYKFVDQGTKGPYPIVAKNADFLAFYTPNFPKTSPGSKTGTMMVQGSMKKIAKIGRPSTHQLTEDIEGEQVLNHRKSVMHPGIAARNFTASLRDQLRQKGPGSFKNITDAAIKRGMRKIGKRR